MREAGKCRQARSQVAEDTGPAGRGCHAHFRRTRPRQGHDLRWVRRESAQAGTTRPWEEPRLGAGQGREPGPGRLRRGERAERLRGARHRGQGTAGERPPASASGCGLGPRRLPVRSETTTGGDALAARRSRVATTGHRETWTQHEALQLPRVNSVHRPLLTQQVSRQRGSRERRRLRPSLRYQGGAGRTGAFRGPCRPPSQSAPSPSAFPP